MNDKQIVKLYKWQENILPKLIPIKHRVPISFKEAKLFANFVCSEQKFYMPKLKRKKLKRYIYAEFDHINYRIIINKRFKGLNRWVYLHEIAHIPYENYSIPDHGKRFVGFFIQLLSIYLEISLETLKQSVIDYGLKYKM